MDDTTSPQPSGAAAAGRARWIMVLLVRFTLLAAAVFVLQLSGTAAWDALVLGMRGEHHAAAVTEVSRTSWARADHVVVAVSAIGPSAAVTTLRKDLDVGDRVEVIVDPRDPRRAALAGDGWPWRQVVLPLSALPLIILYGVRYGRRPAVARS